MPPAGPASPPGLPFVPQNATPQFIPSHALEFARFQSSIRRHAEITVTLSVHRVRSAPRTGPRSATGELTNPVSQVPLLPP